MTSTDEAAERASFMYYLSMLFYSPANRDACLAKVTTISFNKQAKEAIEKDAEKLDFTPELAKFRFPALVITGRLDMNVAPLVAYKIHKAIPNSSFVVFEQSGHPSRCRGVCRGGTCQSGRRFGLGTRGGTRSAD